ncbi:hypothetical protein M422DRAFT_241198 [Sphaerobolus stellatus SS14]|nr:hypothetical protein M422DRAFT_241198 [Sphaerobolus stellatus SS14]
MGDRATQLMGILEKFCQSSPDGLRSIDLAKKLSHFSFDFMGIWRTFDGGFDLMNDNDEKGIWSKMDIVYIMQHVPWFGDIVRANLPYVGGKGDGFRQFAAQQAIRRTAEPVKRKDLFYHLQAAIDSEGTKAPFEWMVNNAMIAIAGGSDTTATTPSNAIYYIIAIPEGELRLDVTVLQSLSYLNAIINEILRCQPLVASGLQRAPSKNSGGIMLGNMFISEGTAVTIQPYIFHRDPRYIFPRSSEWEKDLMDYYFLSKGKLPVKLKIRKY